MDLYSYFEFIYDLCELLLEFNIKVNRNSFCYKVLKKANYNISFYDIAKTNPKLEAKCICILTILKNIGINHQKYTPIYSFYSEISFREYFLLTHLKKKGYDLQFNQEAYAINNFLTFFDDKKYVNIPILSATEKAIIIKNWNGSINSDCRLLIALKNNLICTKEIRIDLKKINNVNLLLLDNEIKNNDSFKEA